VESVGGRGDGIAVLRRQLAGIDDVMRDVRRFSSLPPASCNMNFMAADMNNAIDPVMLV